MTLSKGKASRQRMINLMYLVFIAMLALNVSTEVLDGFDLINDNLNQTIKNTKVRNLQIYSEIEDSYKLNPEKTRSSFDKAQHVKAATDSVFNYIQSLKLQIAQKSDGKSADIDNLQSKDNIDASSQVMITNGQGKLLEKAVDDYREGIIGLITDTAKQKVIRAGLSTEPSAKAKKDNMSWVQASFERMPSIAVMTYLTGLQVNVKQAEGEVLNSLLKDIDLSDFRVNELTAFVVPESNVVMRGTSYKANILLAAVDTTQRPRIVVNNTELPAAKNGFYEVSTGTSGLFKLNGFIELISRDGTPIRRDFTKEYTVMEPMATIAPTLMNVLYFGIANPVSISVPGIVNSDVFASAEGGTLARDGNNWVARPARAGQNFTIVVSTRTNGVQQVVARKEFKVRALPDPAAFISYNDDKGNTKLFKRGALARSVLLSAPGIQAAIDDGILNIPFTVLSFRTISVDAMGNAMPEPSAGASFSARQLDQIRRMPRGAYFFISGIKVKGPDGIEREIATMDIRIN